MPARRTEGPHVHGYRVTAECPDELCRAYWRGYMRGIRSVRRASRADQAATIAAIRAATPDQRDGPVRTRRGA